MQISYLQARRLGRLLSCNREQMEALLLRDLLLRNLPLRDLPNFPFLKRLQLSFADKVRNSSPQLGYGEGVPQDQYSSRSRSTFEENPAYD